MSLDIYEKILTYKQCDDKSIYLVRNAIDHLLYVERHIHLKNKQVYIEIQKMNHPFIPRIYEIIEKDSELIVIEEYVNASTLDSYIMNNELDFKQKETIIFELLDAVEILHQHNIIHRDIKPENVFYDGMHMKLFDFDIARVLCKDKTKDTHILGSVGYAAPEQFGFSQSDERTDIYALGVFINMLLTGCLPDERICDGYMGDVVKKAIHIDPNQRYQSVRELELALLRKSKSDWTLPGFRTGQLSHKIIAVLGYLGIVYLFFVSEYEGIVKWSYEDILNRILLLCIFFSTVFYITNYKNIRDYGLFHHNRNKFIRILGHAITLFMIWLTFTVFIAFFMPSS